MSPRTTARRLVTGLLLAAVAFALSGCDSTGSTGDKGYIDGRGIVTRLSVGEREVPGPVSGVTLEGKKVSLEDPAYAGKVIVLNVWGSWCAQCRSEAPALGGAARELAADGVVFLGINTRDASTAQGLAFQKNLDVPYPSLFDPSGRTLLSFRGTLPPNAIPSTVVIDAQGRVAASILGEVPSQQTLVELVRDVMAA